MLFSVEKAFVGRDEKRAPLKTPAWEASDFSACSYLLFWLEILTAKVFYRKH